MQCAIMSLNMALWATRKKSQAWAELAFSIPTSARRSKIAAPTSFKLRISDRSNRSVLVIILTPNVRDQRRAGTSPAKLDDAVRRVLCIVLLGVTVLSCNALLHLLAHLPRCRTWLRAVQLYRCNPSSRL